jgi:hypothetical protein
MAKVQLLPWLWGAIGVAALVAMLIVTPLSLAGWVAGVAYILVSNLLLSLGLRRRRMTRLGSANAATATRSLLVGLIASLVVTAFSGPIPVPLLIVLTAIALILDAVDGWLRSVRASTWRSTHSSCSC